MGLKQKQMKLRQKAYFEQQLKDRLSFLSGKGIVSPKADKDPLVRKLKADIRAMKNRLKLVADNEKKMEELARIKAEKAAAALKEKESGKSEKPKKAAEEGKGKKIKAERAAAPPKAPEGGKSKKTTEPPGEAQATMEKKVEETKEEPAGQVKADK
jgi:peptidoglycan hydrolase CwlO-like protein